MEAAPAAPAHAAAEKPAAKPPAVQAEQRRDEPKRSEERGIATVRVQAERLDELMDRVGELVIAQARLSQLAATGSDLSIKMIAEEIERLAASLRDTTWAPAWCRLARCSAVFAGWSMIYRVISPSPSSS